MSFEDTIRYELERAGAIIPVGGVDLGGTLSRGRRIRRRKVAATVMAAAALIVVAGGGGALLTASPEPAPHQGPAGEPSRDEAPSSGEDGRDQENPSFSRVEPVLREWLTAIQRSDEDQAWNLMTLEAQAAVGRAEFDRMMASELPESLGAFADAQNFHYIVVTSGTDEAQVVGVASGEITREASTEFAAMAIPMTVQGQQTLVDDTIVDRAQYYDRVAVFASVSAGPLSFRSGDELVVEFARPDGVTDAVIGLDDDRQPLPTEFDGQTGRATAVLNENLREGPHVATVIVQHESGRLYAETIAFEAAAP